MMSSWSAHTSSVQSPTLGFPRQVKATALLHVARPVHKTPAAGMLAAEALALTCYVRSAIGARKHSGSVYVQLERAPLHVGSSRGQGWVSGASQELRLGLGL